MLNIHNINSLSKDEEITIIKEIKERLKSNDARIEGIFNSHLINFNYDTKFSLYELELKNVKNVLIDLSILLGYDIEPCKDIINAKYGHISGITYPIFKECLYDFLDKKEIKLSSMFYADQNSIPIEKLPKIEEPKIQNLNINSIISQSNDINLLILHRSLYILKKKFEIYDKEIHNVYQRFCENLIDFYGKNNKNKNNSKLNISNSSGNNLNNSGLPSDNIIDIDKIATVLEKIGFFTLMDLDTFTDYSDINLKEMGFATKYFSNQEVVNRLFVFIKYFRRKYNVIYKDKKRKKEKFNLADYDDYFPSGVDELMREVDMKTGEIKSSENSEGDSQDKLDSSEDKEEEDEDKDKDTVDKGKKKKGKKIIKGSKKKMKDTEKSEDKDDKEESDKENEDENDGTDKVKKTKGKVKGKGKKTKETENDKDEKEDKEENEDKEEDDKDTSKKGHAKKGSVKKVKGKDGKDNEKEDQEDKNVDQKEKGKGKGKDKEEDDKDKDNKEKNKKGSDKKGEDKKESDKKDKDKKEKDKKEVDKKDEDKKDKDKDKDKKEKEKDKDKDKDKKEKDKKEEDKKDKDKKDKDKDKKEADKKEDDKKEAGKKKLDKKEDDKKEKDKKEEDKKEKDKKEKDKKEADKKEADKDEKDKKDTKNHKKKQEEKDNENNDEDKDEKDKPKATKGVSSKKSVKGKTGKKDEEDNIESESKESKDDKEDKENKGEKGEKVFSKNHKKSDQMKENKDKENVDAQQSPKTSEIPNTSSDPNISNLQSTSNLPVEKELSNSSSNRESKNGPENNRDQSVSPLVIKDNNSKQTKKQKYYKYYLYIETLPLIIADFLTSNTNFAVIDYGSELRDKLREMFDNEIIRRLSEMEVNKINENRNEKLRDLLLNQAKLEKNIMSYTDLFNKKMMSGENVQFIQNILNKLNQTKGWLDSKVKMIQNDTNTYNDYANIKPNRVNNNMLNYNNSNLNTGKYINNYNNGVNNMNYINNQGNSYRNNNQNPMNDQMPNYNNNISGYNDMSLNNSNVENNLSNINNMNYLSNDNSNMFNEKGSRNDNNLYTNSQVNTNMNTNMNTNIMSTNMNNNLINYNRQVPNQRNKSFVDPSAGLYLKNSVSSDNDIPYMKFPNNSYNNMTSLPSYRNEIQTSNTAPMNTPNQQQINNNNMQGNMRQFNPILPYMSMNSNNNFNPLLEDPYKNLNKSNNNISTISNNKNNYMNLNSKQNQVKSQSEQRDINLKEIFYFYSHQHTMLGNKSTFESLSEKFERLNPSEFLKFCSDFRILLSKEKIQKCFRKSTGNSKEMVFPDFRISLLNLAKELNEDKIMQLRKKKIKLANQLKEEEFNLNNQKSLSNKKQISNKAKDSSNKLLVKELIENQILCAKNEIEMLSKKSIQELYEDLLIYIEIDYPPNYQPKMKGFTLPFLRNNSYSNIKKPNRLPKINLSPRMKELNKETINEIKSMLDEKRKYEKNELDKINRVMGMEREYQKKRLDEINKNISLNLNKKFDLRNIKDDFHNYNLEKYQNTKKRNSSDIRSANYNNSYSRNVSMDKGKNYYVADKPYMNLKNMESKDRNYSRFVMEKDQRNTDGINYYEKYGSNNNMRNMEHGNQFTWSAIEKMSTNQLVDKKDILKLIE